MANPMSPIRHCLSITREHIHQIVLRPPIQCLQTRMSMLNWIRSNLHCLMTLLLTMSWPRQRMESTHHPIMRDSSTLSPSLAWHLLLSAHTYQMKLCLSLSQDEQALFNRLKSLVTEFQTAQTNMAEPLSEQSNLAIDFSALHDIINQQNRIHDGLSFEGIFNLRDPHTFAAGSQTNPNILTQSQMFKAADHKDFIESQVSEIDGLIKAGVFEYLQMNELPLATRLLNAIWSYHQKCQPDHSLLKHKSRICIDGSKQQHGIDYWDTYSPVVHWSTIQMVLVLSAILGLKSCQVNYTQAFPQAPLDDPIFMQIPQGWTYDPMQQQIVQSDDPKSIDQDYFIRLQCNLYGCKQAAQNWYLHLKASLEARGFVPSKIDPCLYI